MRGQVDNSLTGLMYAATDGDYGYVRRAFLPQTLVRFELADFREETVRFVTIPTEQDMQTSHTGSWQQDEFLYASKFHGYVYFSAGPFWIGRIKL